VSPDLAKIGKQTHLSLPDAAAYLGISQTTMRRYAVAAPPKIPYEKNRLGAYLFKIADLDAFIEEQGMAHS
jgi:hypothetical protein